MNPNAAAFSPPNQMAGLDGHNFAAAIAGARLQTTHAAANQVDARYAQALVAQIPPALASTLAQLLAGLYQNDAVLSAAAHARGAMPLAAFRATDTFPSGTDAWGRWQQLARGNAPAHMLIIAFFEHQAGRADQADDTLVEFRQRSLARRSALTIASTADAWRAVTVFFAELDNEAAAHYLQHQIRMLSDNDRITLFADITGQPYAPLIRHIILQNREATLAEHAADVAEAAENAGEDDNAPAPPAPRSVPTTFTELLEVIQRREYLAILIGGRLAQPAITQGAPAAHAPAQAPPAQNPNRNRRNHDRNTYAQVAAQPPPAQRNAANVAQAAPLVADPPNEYPKCHNCGGARHPIGRHLDGRAWCPSCYIRHKPGAHEVDPARIEANRAADVARQEEHAARKAARPQVPP